MKKLIIVLSILCVGVAFGIVMVKNVNVTKPLKAQSILKKKKEPEAATLLRKLALKYKTARKYYTNIYYQVYDSDKPGRIVEDFQGVYAYDIQNYYIKSIECENILNENYHILVSDEEKAIFISPRDSADDGSQYVFNPGTMDSIQILAIGEILLDKTNPENYHITYNPRLENWQKIDISFNPKTMEVNTVLMWMGESYTDPEFGEIKDPIVRCVYSNQKFNEIIDPQLFETAKYFSSTGKGYSGVGRFLNYDIEFMK